MIYLIPYVGVLVYYIIGFIFICEYKINMQEHWVIIGFMFILFGNYLLIKAGEYK